MDPGHVFVFACHHYNLVDTVKRIVVMSRPGRMGVYWTNCCLFNLRKTLVLTQSLQVCLMPMCTKSFSFFKIILSMLVKPIFPLITNIVIPPPLFWWQIKSDTEYRMSFSVKKFLKDSLRSHTRN